ncbi:MAG: hypothetical protein ABFS43_09900 [Thermodesulfobacteriota bacterium]
MNQTENKYKVTVFTPFEFQEGQKIYIAKGPRKGDWEVVGITERKVKLRCPVSLREFEWNRFCYQTEERVLGEWPQKD